MTLQLHELLLKANLLAVLRQPVILEENSGKDLGGRELKAVLKEILLSWCPSTTDLQRLDFMRKRNDWCTN